MVNGHWSMRNNEQLFSCRCQLPIDLLTNDQFLSLALTPPRASPCGSRRDVFRDRIGRSMDCAGRNLGRPVCGPPALVALRSTGQPDAVHRACRLDHGPSHLL